MVLNEVARQTGVYVRTLRYRAQKLFGRAKGEFTDEEVTAILESLVASKQWQRTKGNVSLDTKGNVSLDTKGNVSLEEKDNKSIKLDAQLIVSIDRLLQFKIPHWKDYDRHLQVLSTRWQRKVLLSMNET